MLYEDMIGDDLFFISMCKEKGGGMVLNKFFVGLVLLFCLLNISVNSFAEDYLSNNQVKAVAEPMLDNIMNGLSFDKYLTYTKDFDPELKVLGARTKFFQVSRYMQNSLGKYLSREYLGSLHKKQGIIVVLWKAVFSKSKDDILIKLIITKNNKKYFVSGVWLQ